MRLLLVEDDVQLAQGLQKSLRREGFVVNHVTTGKEALHTVSVGECDGVILDLGLPDIDGITVLKTIRNSKNQLPVLVLTARDTLGDKIKGLDLGADDYIAKPFDMTELFARLRVIERRLGTVNTAIVSIGEVTIDTSAHRVMVAGAEIELSRKEYMVLKALMEHAGRIQSREQLESKLYDWGEEVASNAIEVHIHHIRKQLPVNFIKTVRGVGYSVSNA